MSGHTPGPWKWQDKPGLSALRSADGDVLSYSGYENLWPGQYNDETDAANMALIAAAPDLLEALAYCADWIEGLIKASAHCGDSDYDCPLQDCHKPGDLAGVLAKARAAQDKAAGR